MLRQSNGFCNDIFWVVAVFGLRFHQKCHNFRWPPLQWGCVDCEIGKRNPNLHSILKGGTRSPTFVFQNAQTNECRAKSAGIANWVKGPVPLSSPRVGTTPLKRDWSKIMAFFRPHWPNPRFWRGKPLQNRYFLLTLLICSHDIIVTLMGSNTYPKHNS